MLLVEDLVASDHEGPVLAAFQPLRSSPVSRYRLTGYAPLDDLCLVLHLDEILGALGGAPMLLLLCLLVTGCRARSRRSG